MFSLDEIRIASPCRSDWNQMYGDDRRRYCSECKLNVYNLSGMTRDDAERLVMNSEGRLCVRFYRRKDGTILTQDCPVGWKAIKRRVSRVATACASVIGAFLAGVLSLRAVDSAISLIPTGDVAPPPLIKLPVLEVETPEVGMLPAWRGKPSLQEIRRNPRTIYAVGRVEHFDRLEDSKVKVWIK